MTIKKITRFSIYILFIIWIFGSWSLALDEFSEWHICPTLLNIPACYIIFLCFIVLLVLFIFKKDIYFYTVAFFPISVALYGTISQIFWNIECPKTESWIPMCFISLWLFGSLCLCKYLISRKCKKQIK